MRSVREKLLDILEAINKIEEQTRIGHEIFNQNELIQIWVIHYLTVIGEAARVLPDDFKKNHPEINWKGINEMRNVLVHVYFGIDLEAVWDAVENDIPKLRETIMGILEREF